MSADLYQAMCRDEGTTDTPSSDLTFVLPLSAMQAGLPRQLTAELFPGVREEPGNPLAGKPCRIVVRGLTRPTHVLVRDHQNREIAHREVRHSPDVTMPLTMLREVISYSDLKIELRPINIPAQRAAS